MIESGDDLVTLVTARSAFEAHTIVALLEEEQIGAITFDTASTSFGFSIEPYHRGVPVQVRRDDAERAHQVLQQRQSDSVDIDWERFDVGEREDHLPLRRPGRMPLLAKVAFVVTLVVLLAGTLGGLAVSLLPWILG
jgi:hypothetical protein